MGQLTEKEAEDLLQKEGFDVVQRIIAQNKDDLINIAKNIPFPWVMKVSSINIVHKAKTGGVFVNVQNIIQAQVKFDEISKIQGSSGAMIQKMISGEEIIIGIKKTPEFGHTLMFGKGGSNVQKDKDISFRVIPASKKDIKEMIGETKISIELKDKKANIKKLYSVLGKIEKLVSKYPSINELDINPLFLNSKESIVVDARISFDK